MRCVRGYLGIYETEVCKNCGKEFLRRKRAITSNRRSAIGVRGFKMITCSKKCSKEYHYKIRK